MQFRLSRLLSGPHRRFPPEQALFPAFLIALRVHIIEPAVSTYKTSVTDTGGNVRFAFAKTPALFLTPYRHETWPPAIRLWTILTYYGSSPACWDT
ncbi:MAG: hypothetical protein LBS79_06910 [Tannerella sp.]|nr:hypothetical protein [Tannerella sp.]